MYSVKCGRRCKPSERVFAGITGIKKTHIVNKLALIKAKVERLSNREDLNLVHQKWIERYARITIGAKPNVTK